MKKALGNAPIISKKLGIKTIKELADEWVKLMELESTIKRKGV